MKPKIIMGATLGTLLLGACAKQPPLLVDQGADGFERHPYKHREKPQYIAKGHYKGFNKLFVEPGDVSMISPSKPPPTPPIVDNSPDLPEGMVPAFTVAVYADALGEGLGFDDVVAAVRTVHDGPMVSVPLSLLLVVPAPAADGERSRLRARLNKLDVHGTKLSELSAIAPADELPKAVTMGRVMESTKGDPSGLIVVGPQPPPPTYPANGTLKLHNDTTAWAEVTIAGNKIGVIGPLVIAEIAGVKTGTYTVSYLLPNGYVFSRDETTDTVNGAL